MFDSIGEGHKIMQRSVSNDEALRQAYAADPMQAVIDMHELAREANEIEEKVRLLVAKNVALKKRLAEYSGELAVLFGVKHDLEKRVRELERERDWLALQHARACLDAASDACSWNTGDCPVCPLEKGSRCLEVTSKTFIEAAEKAAKEAEKPCP